MNNTTVAKRIWSRVNSTMINYTEQEKLYIASWIYDNYFEFKNDEPQYNDTQQLKFSCAVWLEDDDYYVSFIKEFRDDPRLNADDLARIKKFRESARV